MTSLHFLIRCRSVWWQPLAGLLLQTLVGGSFSSADGFLQDHVTERIVASVPPCLHLTTPLAVNTGRTFGCRHREIFYIWHSLFRVALRVEALLDKAPFQRGSAVDPGCATLRAFGTALDAGVQPSS